MNSLIDQLREIMSEVSWNPEIRCRHGKFVGLSPETAARIKKLITAVVHSSIGESDEFLVALSEASKSDSSDVSRTMIRSVWDLPMAPDAMAMQAMINQGMSMRDAIRELRERAGVTPDQRIPYVS